MAPENLEVFLWRNIMKISSEIERLQDESRRQILADAINCMPVLDKDRAEEDLAMLRGMGSRNIQRLEEKVRDGNPIRTAVAITRVRTEIQNLILLVKPSEHNNLTTKENYRGITSNPTGLTPIPVEVDLFEATVDRNR